MVHSNEMKWRKRGRLGLEPILYHPGMMLHNWGTFLFLSVLCSLDFTAPIWWNWVTPTSCYPPPLHNTGMFPLHDVLMFFWICPNSMPHLLVPFTADVRHILLVNIGMVDLLPWLVFRAGTTTDQFRRVPEWRGALFIPRNTNQTRAQHLIYHPNISCWN